MACEFSRIRELVLPLVADANPNTTAPAASALIQLQRVAPNDGQDDMNAVGFYFRGLTAAGVLITPGTVTYTLWAKDATGSFVILGTGAAVADLTMFTAACPQGAQLFFQVTATTGFATATRLQARATERAA